MSRKAHVASIAALDDFRAKLVVYRSKAGRVLDDVRQEVVSTRIWLQTDRHLHWKHELRKRGNKLAQAEQELLSARFSGHPAAIQERRLAVQRARLSVEEAERALLGVKTWLRRYETEVESHLKGVNQLRHWLTQDLGKGIQFLEAAGKTLTEYAGRSTSPTAPLTQGASPAAAIPRSPSEDAATKDGDS